MMKLSALNAGKVLKKRTKGFYHSGRGGMSGERVEVLGENDKLV